MKMKELFTKEGVMHDIERSRPTITGLLESKNLKPVGEFESFEHELRLLLAGPCTKRYTFLHHNLQ